jgi:hypothetical protein
MTEPYTSAPMEKNDGIREGVGSVTYTDTRKEIFDRLMAKGIQEVVSDPPAFRQQLDRHFERMPARSASSPSLSVRYALVFVLSPASAWLTCGGSYSIDLDVEKAEDVLLHRRILDECADPDKRPVFHVRFLRVSTSTTPLTDRASSFNHVRRSASIVFSH